MGAQFWLLAMLVFTPITSPRKTHPKQREGSFGEKSKWAMNEHPILVTSNEKERNPFISLLLRPPPTHTLAMRERERNINLFTLCLLPLGASPKNISQTTIGDVVARKVRGRINGYPISKTTKSKEKSLHILLVPPPKKKLPPKNVPNNERDLMARRVRGRRMGAQFW